MTPGMKPRSPASPCRAGKAGAFRIRCLLSGTILRTRPGVSQRPQLGGRRLEMGGRGHFTADVVQPEKTWHYFMNKTNYS